MRREERRREATGRAWMIGDERETLEEEAWAGGGREPRIVRCEMCEWYKSGIARGLWCLGNMSGTKSRA